MESWEDLRKQARKLENEIDLKLVSFSKILGLDHPMFTSLTVRTTKNVDMGWDWDSFEFRAFRFFIKLPKELKEIFIKAESPNLFIKLSSVNEKMAEVSSNGDMPASPAMLHTLQRHKEILQDYTQEFRKTHANICARREREDLLHSVRKDIDSFKSSSGLNRRMDLYLKENEHIRKLIVVP
ncbi:unnamed protein product [Bemisia tabaci]|uniref:Golgi SNAP receptor complex member 1 n=1 Tax=Bemisia tabaci TaxID=7038 RepID=A0A9P0C773_BEMTA|nr:unnamed protein product [Bemisia tabaci]